RVDRRRAGRRTRCPGRGTPTTAVAAGRAPAVAGSRRHRRGRWRKAADAVEWLRARGASSAEQGGQDRLPGELARRHARAGPATGATAVVSRAAAGAAVGAEKEAVVGGSAGRGGRAGYSGRRRAAATSWGKAGIVGVPAHRSGQPTGPSVVWAAAGRR